MYEKQLIYHYILCEANTLVVLNYITNVKKFG